METVEIAGHEAICDGGGGALGHPRVYLHFDHDSHSVTCPYCSRVFVQKQHGHAA